MAQPLQHAGKSYTNADAWRTAKATTSGKPPMPEQGEPGGEEEQDGAAIAQEHGPAAEIQMQHEHEMGSHHVHSMHPDSHEHHSDHASAEEAHEHAKKLAGIGGAEHEGEEGYEGGEKEY